MTSTVVNHPRLLTLPDVSEFRGKDQWVEYINSKVDASFQSFFEKVVNHPNYEDFREEIGEQSTLFSRWRGVHLDLKEKNLSNLNITDLTEALKESPKVASVDLSSNKLSDDSASTLASALRVKSFLAVNDVLKSPALDLGNNDLSFAGAEAILNALHESGRSEVQVHFGQQSRMLSEDSTRLQKYSLILTFRNEMEKNGEDLEMFRARVHEELKSANSIVLYPLMLEVLRDEFGVEIPKES